MSKGWVYSLGLSLSAVLVGTAAAAPIVLNSTFEDNSPGPYGAINDWTQTPYPSGLGGFDYLSGTSTPSQFPWDNGYDPGQGTAGQVGSIQVYGSVSTLALDQTVSGFVVGQTYVLSFDYNSRAGTTTPIIQASVGGTVVVAPISDPAVDPPGTYSTPFHSAVSIPFVATATSEVVELRASQSSPGTDATATFDHVAITPEPASLSLIALAGIGLTVRRRRA